jgi:cobalt/nickel transport system ATP-binding protein
MSHHLVEFKDLTYIYLDGTKALQEITFRITHGEAVAYRGSERRGKTIIHDNSP